MTHNSQTAFLRNRNIVQGFLYVQQTIQYARSSNTLLAVFKADISKAFDTVSWEFIIKIMEAKGFPTVWTIWIKQAILPGYTQIILNGLAGKRIILIRGVWQRDPISPYLFILAMDSLYMDKCLYPIRSMEITMEWFKTGCLSFMLMTHCFSYNLPSRNSRF
jgi:Reverse transcriptase (RNA-dependent DNA polymerase)